jgi:hypothetical protein
LRKLVAFKIDARFLDQVDAICEHIMCSRSAFIRRCLQYYIGMSELQMTAVDRELIKQLRDTAPTQKSAAPKQTITEYGAATTSNDNTSNSQVQHTDDPYIPDFIKNAPGFDKEAWLKFRA